MSLASHRATLDGSYQNVSGGEGGIHAPVYQVKLGENSKFGKLDDHSVQHSTVTVERGARVVKSAIGSGSTSVSVCVVS